MTVEVNYKAVKRSFRTIGSSIGSALIGFIQSGTGAKFRNVRGKLMEVVSVLDFINEQEHDAIRARTSTFDTTDAFTAAFTAHDVVRAPAGLYNVSQIELADGKSLLTDGFDTIIQQIAGQDVGTSILRVVGSNVRIGAAKYIGNIATDTNEFNHAIEITAGRYGAGDLENISIGDVYAKDIRGDGVLIAQYALSPGSVARNIHVGNVYYDNVLRNGVSIVGGDTITVKGVQPAGSNRCGYFAMDVESDVGAGTATNVRVGYIKGRHAGLVSQSAADYIDNTEFGIVDLDPAYSDDSSPSYTPGTSIVDAIPLRNVKRARIGQLRVNGFDRCATFISNDVGEIGCEDLRIDSAWVSNCSQNDATYNSYFQGCTLASNSLSIGNLKVSITGSGKRVLDGLYAGRVDSIQADVTTDACLIRNSQDVTLCNVAQSGSGGGMIVGSTRINVKGGSFAGDRLTNFSSACTFEDFTATAAVALFNSGDDHTVVNSTLNGDRYQFGTTAQAYTSTLRFGAYHLWVDSTGVFRIKSSAPTSDTDGTVVGTQS